MRKLAETAARIVAMGGAAFALLLVNNLATQRFASAWQASAVPAAAPAAIAPIVSAAPGGVRS